MEYQSYFIFYFCTVSRPVYPKPTLRCCAWLGVGPLTAAIAIKHLHNKFITALVSQLLVVIGSCPPLSASLPLWTDFYILTLPVPDLILLCCPSKPDYLLYPTTILPDPMPTCFGVKIEFYSLSVSPLGPTLKPDT